MTDFISFRHLSYFDSHNGWQFFISARIHNSRERESCSFRLVPNHISLYHTAQSITYNVFKKPNKLKSETTIYSRGIRALSSTDCSIARQKGQKTKHAKKLTKSTLRSRSIHPRSAKSNPTIIK